MGKIMYITFEPRSLQLVTSHKGIRSHISQEQSHFIFLFHFNWTRAYLDVYWNENAEYIVLIGHYFLKTGYFETEIHLHLCHKNVLSINCFSVKDKFFISLIEYHVFLQIFSLALFSSIANWVTSRKNIATCFVFQISLYNFVAYILFQFYLIAYPSAWHIQCIG